MWLGIIDPDVFLGGRRHLDAKLASEALTQFGEPLGLDVDQAASAIYRLVTAEMGNAIRAVTVERGRDPRQFVMAAFGGALGIFAADIARRTGIGQVVVPAQAAVFSAFGLLGTDDVRALARSAPWAGGDASGARIGSRRIRRPFEDEVVEADAYDALRLTPDVRIAGPAVVEHPFTTIQVPAGCELRVDERGNYLMEVATA